MQHQVPKIARHLKNLKGIYQEDKQAIPIEGTDDFKIYVDFLLSKGLQINNLQTAEFRTKNGLPYIGLIANKEIQGGSILVSVPKNLMLTTKIAFFSEVQEIFEKYPQFYSQYHNGGWQDRILLTYILYQSQLGDKSPWYHLIRNLPKDIDYLIFWKEEELKKLNDPQMINNAKKELKDFEITQKTLTAILDNYPQLFKKETYSYENIKWIYIHLVSRCFGSSLAQVSFVPFCEMFNHDNTDVRYRGKYNLDNPFVENEKELEELDSSIESDGEQYEKNLSDEEYEENILDQISEYKQRIPVYKQIEQEIQIKKKSVNFNDQKEVNDFQTYESKQANRTELLILQMKYKRFLQENLNLKDNFTMIFVNKIIEEMLGYMKDYQLDNLTYEQATKNFQLIEVNCQYYLKYVKEYHQRVNKVNSYQLMQFDFPEESEELETVEKVLGQPQIEGVEHFQSKEQWEEDKFDQFVIQCSQKDNFKKGSQVYFSYGNLSNRLLLLRYGFALEYNIFEHVYVAVNYLESIPNAVDIVDYFKLPKYMRFKLKYNKICEDLLTFCKLKHWKYERPIQFIFKDDDLDKPIMSAINILMQFKEQTKLNMNLQEEIEKLKDKSLGYHEYFAQVFKIERQRIIDVQIESLQLLRAHYNKSKEPICQFEWSKALVNKFINRNQ